MVVAPLRVTKFLLIFPSRNDPGNCDSGDSIINMSRDSNNGNNIGSELDIYQEYQ